MRSILIVDDQPGIRLLLEELFRRENYSVRLAKNGVDAFKKIEAEQPDCVLLDMKMAGIDGTEVLKRIKKEWPAVPVVMMTAYGELETIEEVLALGAEKYFTKPFDIYEVRDSVNAIIGG
ncbi:response regulator [Sporosarcina sp. Marseille-Q4063]|uniref:response regulator n=1 Tax=Sporosarcina sp. Marseille-Q4063 TaxID=2810514 RepID=UPI001BB00AB2|nr:response regulator [Sporosarcina sp. Marseille-Q4063]QUW21149.1 response regulator [Sporosarcina sp. Marseille-Q4063]